MARVEGMTKVVIDENVKKVVSEYINHKLTVSENEWSFFTMKEEITYLTDVLGKRNIEFVCEIQPDEEDYEKDI